MMSLIQTTPTYVFFFFLISPVVSTEHVIIFLFSFEHLLFHHYPFGNMLFRTTTPNKISCDFPASVVSFPSTYLGRFSFTVNICHLWCKRLSKLEKSDKHGFTHPLTERWNKGTTMSSCHAAEIAVRTPFTPSWVLSLSQQFFCIPYAC